jgi:hypothetical protein
MCLFLFCLVHWPLTARPPNCQLLLTAPRLVLNAPKILLTAVDWGVETHQADFRNKHLRCAGTAPMLHPTNHVGCLQRWLEKNSVAFASFLSRGHDVKHALHDNVVTATLPLV